MEVSIFTSIMSVLTSGITAVFGWFNDLLNSIFGSYMVFGFIIVGIMVLTWAVRTLNVMSGSGASDIARYKMDQNKIAAQRWRDHINSIEVPRSTYIQADHGRYRT